MSATMARPMPVAGPVTGRLLLGPAVAVVAGGAVVALVLTVAGHQPGLWAVVAGGLACASGLLLGTTEHVGGGAGLAAAAMGALFLAVATSPAPDASVAAPAAPRAAAPVAGHGAPSATRTNDARTDAGDGPNASAIDARADAASSASATGARVAASGDAPTRASPTAAAPAAEAADLVRNYYAALDAGRFAAAWARLAPHVQTAFGGFEAWRRGYATTLGHGVEAVQVTPGPGGAVVQHVLVAVDRAPCGAAVERRFAVRWRLEHSVATELSAVKLSGREPVEACR
jgi:hypothetical protein